MIWKNKRSPSAIDTRGQPSHRAIQRHTGLSRFALMQERVWDAHGLEGNRSASCCGQYTVCMADLSPDDIRRIARLCRLAVTEDEIEGYRVELAAVLGYFARLGELDLAGIEPLTHVGEGVGTVFDWVIDKGSGAGSHAGDCPNPTGNRLAEDEPGPVLANDVVMGLAPGAKPPFYRVPRVLNEGGGEGSGA